MCRNFYGAEIEVRFDSNALELVGGPLGVDKGRVFVEEAEGQAKVLSWQTPQVVEGPDGTVMRPNPGPTGWGQRACAAPGERHAGDPAIEGAQTRRSCDPIWPGPGL